MLSVEPWLVEPVAIMDNVWSLNRFSALSRAVVGGTSNAAASSSASQSFSALSRAVVGGTSRCRHDAASIPEGFSALSRAVVGGTLHIWQTARSRKSFSALSRAVVGGTSCTPR